MNIREEPTTIKIAIKTWLYFHADESIDYVQKIIFLSFFLFMFIISFIQILFRKNSLCTVREDPLFPVSISAQYKIRNLYTLLYLGIT